SRGLPFLPRATIRCRMHTRLLRFAQRLQSISQAGLAYSRDPYDRERFEQVQGVAAEMLAADMAEPADVILDRLRGEAGYPTPKVDVRTAVFENGRILLVRETADGCWSLPGGWADVGESAAEVAAREVKEESGYDVHVTKLLAVYDKAKHEHPRQFWYVYKILFRAERIGGAPGTGHETSDVGWFARDELPVLSIDRVTPAQIARAFAHYDNPDLPCVFD